MNNDFETQNDHRLEDPFETWLSDGLEQRAGSLDVHQDLEHVMAPGEVRPLATAARRRIEFPVLAAAAVLLIGLVGVVGYSSINSSDDDFVVEAAIDEAFTASWAQALHQPPPEGPTFSSEVVVWLEVNATEADVETFRQWLNANSAVEGFRYIDRAETYAAFTDYFADEPEIIELIAPQQLPTSFLVGATTEAMAEVEQLFDFVDDMESAPES